VATGPDFDHHVDWPAPTWPDAGRAAGKHARVAAGRSWPLRHRGDRLPHLRGSPSTAATTAAAATRVMRNGLPARRAP